MEELVIQKLFRVLILPGKESVVKGSLKISPLSGHEDKPHDNKHSKQLCKT